MARRSFKKYSKRKAEGANELRHERLRHELLLVEVATEIGEPIGRVRRVEKGEYVSNEEEIKEKLRRLYSGARPRRELGEIWKGHPFPTGYQLKMAAQAQGLSVKGLSSVICDEEHGASDWYWWSYIRGDVDSETGRPKRLPVPLQKLARKFVQMTIEELEGLRKPGETLKVFNK